MKIKQKLLSGIGLLFAMIALLTVLSSVRIAMLSADTQNILVANYNTLDYSRNMLIALNDDISLPEQQKFFETNLKKQQANITEIGEQDLTEKLTYDFNKLTSNLTDYQLIKMVRTDISNIMLLNMQAIVRKNKIAEKTAENSIIWVSFTIFLLT